MSPQVLVRALVEFKVGLVFLLVRLFERHKKLTIKGFSYEESSGYRPNAFTTAM